MPASVLDSPADLSIRPDWGEIRHASAWLEKACLERDVPVEQFARLDLCLNEALANVLAHGDAASRQDPIRLWLDVRCGSLEREAVVTVADAGTAFDPLAVASRQRPITLAEAEPGGLGIVMIRSLSDKQDYQYREGRNRLSFSVCWTAA